MAAPCQALPDWKKDAPRGSKQVPASKEVQQHREKLASFLGAHDALEGPKRVARKKEDNPHIANQFFLQCLDHTLVGGTGLALSHFRLERPWRPPAIDEERYYVEAASLEGCVAHPSDPPNRQRSCILNTTTGETRLECPLSYDHDGRLDWASLHAVSDEGPVGAPALWALFSGRFLRGTRRNDPWHKLHRLTQGVVKACGLWVVVLEFTIVFNLLHAPWGGDAFFWTVQDAAKRYMECASIDDPLFGYMYEDLSVSAGSVGLDFGTVEHMQRMLSRLGQSPVLASKGDHVRLGRWMSFFREADKRSDSLYELLVFLVYIGYRCKFWSTIDDSPLTAGRRDDAGGDQEGEDMAEPDPVPDGAPPATVRSSNIELDKLRKTSRNMLDLSCAILGNRLRFRLLQVLRVAHNPIRAAFARWQTMAKTQLGSLEMHFGWCGSETVAQVMHETLSVLSSAECVKQLRFVPRDSGASDGELLDDEYIAGRCLELVSRLAGSIAVFGMQYSHNLPHYFMLLLHPLEEVRARCLSELRRIWFWLSRSFVAGRSDEFVATFLDELEWTRWDWVMSLLVLLSEVDFQHITQDIRTLLVQFSRSMPTTHINEDAFHVLQEAARKSPNGQLAPQSQWHSLVTARLAAEYDRPQVRVDEDARSSCTGQRIPKSMFVADRMDFSLSMETLSKVFAGYTSPSPERSAMIPFCLQCALKYQWSEVKSAWLSLLMQVGFIVVARDAPMSAFLVCHVTKYGCILWPLSTTRTSTGCRNLIVQRPTSEKPVPWQFVAVHDAAHWRMAEAVAIPPAKQSDTDRSRGIMLDLRDRPKDIISSAARQCFPNLQVAHLKKLLGIAGCAFTGRRPTTEADICLALLRKLLPEESDEVMRNILAKRVAPQKLSSVLFEGENLSRVEDCLDEFDKSEFQESKKQHLTETAKARSSKTKAAGSVSCGGGASSSSSGPSRPKLSFTGAKTPQEAKLYCPQIKGCVPKEDSVRHLRWSISYTEKAEPPYSISKSYGDQSTVSRDDALRYCLQRIWVWHEEATGEKCPFDFSSSEPLLSVVTATGSTETSRVAQGS